MAEEPKPLSSYVVIVDIRIADKLIKDLEERGFEICTPPYTVFSAKTKGIACTLYKSGKLMIQGKEKDAFIEFYLEPEILHHFSYNYKNLDLDVAPLDTSTRMGIDESGKGDFFGPLCVAGVFAQGHDIAKLKELGVCDSKKLSDTAILKIGKKIQSQFIHHIVKITPKKYNELYAQFRNLNRLLAWGHATVIEHIAARTQCKKVIVDQFADEQVVLTAIKRKHLNIEVMQRHRAEEDLVVAAASILARMTFIEGIKQLSAEYSIEIPKGASPKVIEAGKALVHKYGEGILSLTGKTHFKTTDIILKGI
jgi:ribonuclease HIII